MILGKYFKVRYLVGMDGYYWAAGFSISVQENTLRITAPINFSVLVVFFFH